MGGGRTLQIMGSLNPLKGQGLLLVTVAALCLALFAGGSGRRAAGMPPSGPSPGDIEQIGSRLRAEYLRHSFQNAAASLASQTAEGSWPDINYGDQSSLTWIPLRHLNRLCELAIAFQTPGNPLYHNPKLPAAISNGLHYWYTARPRSVNWYWNSLGQQDPLGQVLILMEGELPQTLVDSGTARLYDASQVPPQYTTGTNLVWYAKTQLVRGLLRKDPTDIARAAEIFQREVRITASEGIQADFSFHMHGAQLYSGGYGLSSLTSLLESASLLRGTSFAFDSAKIGVISRYLLEGSRLMVRGRLLDYGAQGREISRKEASRKAIALIDPCKQLALLDSANAPAYRDLLNHIQGSGKPYSWLGNRYFWRSDFMVHQRAGYYCSVKMLSSRTIGTECMNSENLKGFWLPFGFTTIVRRGDEYADIFPVWDWGRLPGTTTPHTVPELINFDTQSQSFVGGVSDGTCGAAAMVFSKASTEGRKAWFFFEDECVALGTGLTSGASEEVNTTLNQCLLKGSVLVDGHAVPPGEHALKQARWILHDSVGYVFPAPVDVTLRTGEQRGTWHSINALYTSDTVSAEVFTLWLNHGVHPSNAQYQYVIVPATNEAGLAAYAANPPVKIISNTPNIQAVSQTALKLHEIVFYAAGSVTLDQKLRVSVDLPCMVLLRERSGSVEVAASNPFAQSSHLTVNLTLSNSTHRVSYDLEGGEAGGKSQVKTIPVAAH